MNRFAPIALFVYSRPDHVRGTIEALRSNPESKESHLWIFSDAPKNQAAEAGVREVRSLVHRLSGFASVKVVERERNLGLAGSITDGVTQLSEAYGRVIVLEDDLIVSPYFLDYMNRALDLYADEDRVMHVSGYWFPVGERLPLPASFFLRASSCWGWATWKRAWDQFEPDSSQLLERFDSDHSRYEFDLQGTYPYFQMLQDQALGKIDSWAVRWYASVFLKSGLCLHPASSLVENKGHDGTGIHCPPSGNFDVMPSARRILDYPKEIRESAEALAAVKEFNKTLGAGTGKKMLLRLREFLGIRQK